jgi:hypothetical protein
MSENLFLLLLRLYPSHFRKAYGDEALQLFRDRSRDEKGLYAAVRLWFDLLADFAVTAPREYIQPQRMLIAASTQRPLDGVPFFFVFGTELPSLGAFLSGAVLSLFALGVFSVSLLHLGSHAGEVRSAFGQPQPRSRFSQDQIPQAKQQGASKEIQSAAAERRTQDGAERQRVIDSAAKNLRQYYVYPDVGQEIADSLLTHEKDGDDDATTDGTAFADLLTRQMRNVSHDMHLEVVYSREPLPDPLRVETLEDIARYRNLMERQNCTFEKVQMLPHAIGYFKLNSFPETSVCQQQATAAMASLNGANAVIFDLRDNRGGVPDMVTLIASYLFDHPEYMYNRRENTTKQSWTQSPVPGSRLADKPVYVLTSARTISGAEQFTYDLKMLKRATIVGEKTAGAAHSGVFHRIDDHFGMGIPETKSINPFSKADWSGAGVEPDVKVKAADALETAEKLAAGKLQKQ